MTVKTEFDLGFTEEELRLLLQNIDRLSEREVVAITAQLDELERRKYQTTARDDLIEFCKHMQRDYKVGRHHRILANELMALEAGTKNRAAVNMPPRHGKSQLVSVYYPAWFLGRNPGKQVMMVSHTTDLAVDFGRKVRNIIASPEFREIFPAVELSADSKSAGRWSTSAGGSYFACGVGSALAGRGADLLLIDDPHSEQDVLGGNFSVFEKAYQWFTYGARTRLMPGGRVALVQCMTGDTPVLRPDGQETPLCDIRPGDMVASFDGGRLVARRVLNWQSSGVDDVYTLRTASHTVRANARHPFLVQNGTETPRWVRLGDLRPGDFLVSHQDAETSASRRSGRADVGSAGTVRTTSRSAMASRWRNTLTALYSRAASARFAGSRLRSLLHGGRAATSSVSTTAIPAGRSGLSCAMPATLPSATRERRRLPGLWPRTSHFTKTRIESITPAGRVEVFDIQVEGTENFIAGGLVSHNTRWHMDDLTGRVVRDMVQNEGSDQYEVVELPAIMETLQPDGSRTETALWPEFFDLAALKRTKASMPVFQWNAQYQQNPTAEEGAIIKREWWRIWPTDKLPEVDYVIMALDAAAEATNRADYTSLTTWGVFFNEAEGAHQIVLLNAIKRRVEFPELKVLAAEEYKEWTPDAFIVEKKSSGTALYQEMHRAGLFVQEYTPVRGTANNPNTKMARLNSVADIISSGLVWVPAKRWAEELVEEVAGFPFASNDDQVDTTIMALMRFRQGGFIRLPTDDDDDDVEMERPRIAAYY